MDETKKSRRIVLTFAFCLILFAAVSVGIHIKIRRHDRSNSDKPTAGNKTFLMIAVVLTLCAFVPIIGIVCHNSSLMCLFALALTLIIFMESLGLMYLMQMIQMRQKSQTLEENYDQSLNLTAMDQFLIRNFKCCPTNRKVCCDRQFFNSIGVNCTVNQYKIACSELMNTAFVQNWTILLFSMIGLFWIQIQALIDTWLLVNYFSCR